jgi:hypothetical protein
MVDFVMGFAGVTPGYDAKLIEAKGEGNKVFGDAEARVERRAMIAIAGQLVTTTGGVGFANAEIFETIASHLVTRTAQDLVTTLNDQALPHVLRWGAEAGLISQCDRELLLAYDTKPPQARTAEALALTAVAQAFTALKEAGFTPNRLEFQARFRLPVEAPPEIAALPAAPAALAPEAPSTQERRRSLAADLTQHGAEACRHGNPNVCRICGVRRIDDVVPGVNGGAPGFKLHWYAIDDDERTTAPGGEA